MGCSQTKEIVVDQIHIQLGDCVQVSNGTGTNDASTNTIHLSDVPIELKPGKYEIRTKHTTTYANVKESQTPRIENYDVQHASSDLSRDGVIQATVRFAPEDAKFLWSNGVVTNEPVLYDVSEGLYAMTVFSTRQKLACLHDCDPATVKVRS